MHELNITVSESRFFGCDLHTWKGTINKVFVSDLWLVPIEDQNGELERFGIVNVRTVPGEERKGYARQLYEDASKVAQVWHATGDRLTKDGAAFVAAVGGPQLTQADADKYLPATTWLS